MSFGSVSNSQSLAADGQSLNALKLEAGKGSPAAIKETAKQFESLFMREVMKSMREATMKSGMMDSPGENLGTDLLDQQFAVQMSGQPGGLSDIIALQLTRQMANANKSNATGTATDTSQSATSASTTGTVGTIGTTSTIKAAKASSLSTTPTFGKGSHAPTESQSSFIKKHAQVASDVEKATGIPANFMLGQAAHETGWGKFEIKQKGGAPSHNLFGIKAGAGWTGKVAEVTTTEYVNGVAQKQVGRFKAYDSYADAFKDYAQMISDSPRYAKAKEQSGSAQGFAQGLQKAGYATDPAYAAKLSRAISTTAAIRRAQA